MSFKSTQRTFTRIQVNTGSCKEVFPLLCPVRESEWIEGWEYEMLYSLSGYAEKDCVFSTPYHNDLSTIWQITQYDPINYALEFVRFTQGELIVKINISLKSIDQLTTKSIIQYQYTGLNETQNSYINSTLEEEFEDQMNYWERAINYYLITGQKMKRGG